MKKIGFFRPIKIYVLYIYIYIGDDLYENAKKKVHIVREVGSRMGHNGEEGPIFFFFFN